MFLATWINTANPYNLNSQPSIKYHLAFLILLLVLPFPVMYFHIKLT